MDSDAAPISPAMPRSAPFDPARDLARPAASAAAPAAPPAGERTGVFGHLVHDDGDIAGLVAYSIYKQNKLDWLRAFEALQGRAPEEAEVAAYIIGEGTPRRLATYRHLAEATLAGNGPDVEGVGEPDRAAPRRLDRGRNDRGRLDRGRLDVARIGRSYATGMVALYALIAVLFVIGFYLAMHFTATTR